MSSDFSFCSDPEIYATLHKYLQESSCADDNIGYVRVAHARAWRIEDRRWHVKYQTTDTPRSTADAILNSSLSALDVRNHLIDILSEKAVRAVEDGCYATLDLFFYAQKQQQTRRAATV